MADMQCPKCNTEVNRQAKFCWQCGVVLGPAPSHSSAEASTPASDGRSRGVLAVAAIAVLAALAFLLMRGLLPNDRVVSTAPGGGVGASQPITTETPGSRLIAPADPLTATPPGGPGAGAPVTGAPAGNFALGAGVPSASAPPPNPYRDDVAEYLRKLEAIQRRDAQNPMAEITLMWDAAQALRSGMANLEDDVGARRNHGQVISGYNRILQTKMAIVRDFQMISPVPDPCRVLHHKYGEYLGSTVRVIRQLRDAVAQGNLPAVLAAQSQSGAARAAQGAAEREENRVRRMFNIPRTPERLIP